MDKLTWHRTYDKFNNLTYVLKYNGEEVSVEIDKITSRNEENIRYRTVMKGSNEDDLYEYFERLKQAKSYCFRKLGLM